MHMITSTARRRVLSLSSARSARKDKELGARIAERSIDKQGRVIGE